MVDMESLARLSRFLELLEDRLGSFSAGLPEKSMCMGSLSVFYSIILILKYLATSSTISLSEFSYKDFLSVFGN